MSHDGPYRAAGPRDPHEPDPRPGAVSTWQRDLACPRCAAPLFAARKEGIRVDACGGCGGVWLASAEAQRMLQTKSRAPADLAHTAAARALFPRADKQAAIACPVCGEALARSVTRPLGIEIDVCAAHGTWFDWSELESVVDVLLPKPAAPAAAPMPWGPLRPASRDPSSTPASIPSAPPAAPPRAATASEIAREIRRQEADQRLAQHVVDGVLDALFKG